MEYETIFKCRLCGECYEGGCTGSENIAFSAAISVCLGVPSKDPQAPCMTEVHNCKDGSIGVADFSGIPKGGKEMNMVEYAEKILGANLYPFQKQFLQKLEKLPPNSRLISTPKGWMVVEENPSKEEKS